MFVSCFWSFSAPSRTANIENITHELEERKGNGRIHNTPKWAAQHIWTNTRTINFLFLSYALYHCLSLDLPHSHSFSPFGSGQSIDSTSCVIEYINTSNFLFLWTKSTRNLNSKEREREKETKSVKRWRWDGENEIQLIKSLAEIDCN